MIENIAMWGGLAGCVLALVAIIILFLTRQSIVHMLDKDELLFSENFITKKDAICLALSLVDEISSKGNAVKNNVEFNQKAKKCYNDLLCVLSDVRIADEFYEIALGVNFEFNESRIAQFKLMCRYDLGLSVKHAMIVKRTLEKPAKTTQMPRVTQPVQQPARPNTVAQPNAVQPNTAQPKPIQPRPIQPSPSVKRVEKPKN